MFKKLEFKDQGFVWKESDQKELHKIIIDNRLQDDDVKDHDFYIKNNLNILKEIENLKDIDKASSLIKEAIENKKHIALATDYDSDGINSAAVLYLAMRDVFKVDMENVSMFVNKRRDGNGFNKTFMGKILQRHEEKPIDIIITADHGSSDEEQMAILKDKGMQTILTDHHKIKEDTHKKILNNTCGSIDAFINPERDDNKKYLPVSGCVVAYLLMIKTYQLLNKTDDITPMFQLSSFAAVSTITDVMSLKILLNRSIVKTGLNELNSFRNKMWLAIRNTLGMTNLITSKDLGFKIGPLINSANRTDQEEIAFKLLVSKNYEEAAKYAKALAKLNNTRKVTQKSLYKKVQDEIDIKEYPNSITLMIETPLSINGSIASMVGEKYNLPTVCFTNTDNDDTMSGSLRSIISELDITRVLDLINKEDDTILVGYGGHKGAAGCKIYKDMYLRFKELFDKYCKELLKDIDLDKKIYIDACIDDRYITVPLAREIELAGPYGKDWSEPVLLSKLQVMGDVKVYNGAAKILFKTADNNFVSGMYFYNSSDRLNPDNIKSVIYSGIECLVAYNLHLNSFMGSIEVSMSIASIRKINEGPQYV